jgi:hypothetical protein
VLDLISAQWNSSSKIGGLLLPFLIYYYRKSVLSRTSFWVKVPQVKYALWSDFEVISGRRGEVI